jgi:hypothetical protein
MFGKESDIRRSIERSLNKDSTPGYPYAALASSNKKLMDEHGDLVWKLVVDRLNTWAEYHGDYNSMEAEEMVEKNFCDPVKLFVKDEPHSKEKVAKGKFRIISSVSLVDQIIERLLHSKQNMNEIEMWDTCPSKPGLGLHDDGMKLIEKSIERLLSVNGKVMCTDVSGWDWSVQQWELEDDMECRWRLAGQTEDSLFAHLCRVNAMVVGKSVFVDSDGICYAQPEGGVQLSGRYCTSSSNSRMRVIATMHARIEAGLEPTYNGKIGIDAMGDDSNEVHAPEIIEKFYCLGHTIKEVSVHDKVAGVEFCSQIFNQDGFAYPAKPSKTAFRFFGRPTTNTEYPDLWPQLSFYLRHLVGDEKEKIGKLAMARVEGAIKRLNGKQENEASRAEARK